MKAPSPPWLGAASRFGAVLLAGALYGLAFPPFEWSALAWLCLVPLFYALPRSGPAESLAWMWCFAMAASYGSGHWLPDAVETYYLQPAWVGWLFFFGIATLNAAPYYLPLALALRTLERRFGGSLTWPFVAAAAWTAAELARGRLLNDLGVFISNPWAQLGYSQVAHLPLLQVTAITGIYGLTFAIVSFNAGVLVALEGLRRPEVRRRASAAALLAAAPLAAIALGGQIALSGAPEPGAALVEPRRVAVAQGNIPSSSRWRSDRYGRNLETYLRLTLDSAREAGPELVVWPESAMTFFLESEPGYRRSIASVLSGFDLELVAGGPRVEGPAEDPTGYFNSVFSVLPDGEIRGRYDKQKLVPFGEYFPFRTIEFLRRRFEKVRTFTPGSGPDLLPTTLGGVAVATCNEVMLPEIVARRVRAGGTLIVSPSNDTWSPEPVFAEQMLDMALVRAVEQRRWLLRASTTGPSAIVDPWGRVVARTQIGDRGWISGDVEPVDELSLYGRIGDAFAAVCSASALLLWGWARHGRRPSSGSTARDAEA